MVQCALVMDAKIVSLRQLKAVLEKARKSGKRIVHCHGIFDLLHPGHIRHFASARKLGDILVVTVTPDRFVNKGPGRPAFTEELRVESLAALGHIDFVAINEWPTAIETIALLRPHVYAKGSEYRDATSDVTGMITKEEEAVKSGGGVMHFTDDITFSSSKLLNAYIDILPAGARTFLSSLATRHPAQKVIDHLRTMKNMSVLVVGDTIIDEYHSCKPIGMASKSATLNARFLEAESYAGGALAIANHVAGFCGHVDLVTCLGATNTQESVIRAALKKSVKPYFIVRPDGPTTIKRRYIDLFRYHKLFEVTFLQDQPLPQQSMRALHDCLEKLPKRYDAVLISDFGHGMFAKPTKDFLCKRKDFLALNVQTNSANFGFNAITAYRRAEYVSVDERELRIAFHDRFAPVDTLMSRLQSDLGCDLLTVTLGQAGAIVRTKKKKSLTVPAFIQEVIDTVGAGDAFFSLAALCAARKLPPELIGFLGSAAGAIASRIVGNRESIEFPLLSKYVTRLLK